MYELVNELIECRQMCLKTAQTNPGLLNIKGEEEYVMQWFITWNSLCLNILPLPWMITMANRDDNIKHSACREVHPMSVMYCNASYHL